jgi:hypothetical protein
MKQPDSRGGREKVILIRIKRNVSTIQERIGGEDAGFLCFEHGGGVFVRNVFTKFRGVIFHMIDVRTPS